MKQKFNLGYMKKNKENYTAYKCNTYLKFS